MLISTPHHTRTPMNANERPHQLIMKKWTMSPYAEAIIRWAHYFHWMNTYPKNASASDESIGLKPRRAYMFQEPNQYSISLVTCWHELQNITELIHRNHQIGNLRSCLVIVACAVVPVLMKHCNVSQKVGRESKQIHTHNYCMIHTLACAACRWRGQFAHWKVTWLVFLVVPK